VPPIAPPPAELPVTGSPVAGVAGLGLALVLAGVALLLDPRVRRRFAHRH